MIWDKNKESYVIELRSKGLTYKEIALLLGTTDTSVKHKVRRLQQSNNDDKYKHTKEKIDIIKKLGISVKGNVLETNCGFGGMTEFYANTANTVESYDINKKRVDHINLKGFENVTATKADSELEIKRLSYFKCKYDLVDLDPYGLPSRYMADVFNLIDDGWLFITFPMLGVAQINKITIQHYKSFWNFDISQGSDAYLDCIKGKLFDYAFTCKREIDIASIEKIDRVYRFSIKVKKKSLCDIVGLTVNRKGTL